LYKHIVKAFVPLPNAEFVAENICARVRIYCRSISATGTERHLDFGDARVNMKPNVKGLFLRVKAKDLVTFYGIRTLLQGHLFATTTIPGGSVQWYSATPPSGAGPSHAGDRRNSSNGK